MIKDVDTQKNKKSDKLMVISDVWIKKIIVEQVSKLSNHYEVTLRVHGRTRFCYYLPSAEFLVYKIRARYGQLEKVDKALKKAVPKIQEKDMIGFPERSRFSSKKEIPEKRLEQFTQYFDCLLACFPKANPVLEPLIDLCTPPSINILVVGENEEKINDYLNNLILAICNNEKINPKSTMAMRDNITAKPRSFWKLHCPIDYLSLDKSFRLDFVNYYFEPKVNVDYMLGYSDCVIILIDPDNDDWLGKQLSTISLYNKTASKGIKVMVLTTSGVMPSEPDLKNIKVSYENKFNGMASRIEFANYIPETGGSVNPIDVILPIILN